MKETLNEHCREVIISEHNGLTEICFPSHVRCNIQRLNKKAINYLITGFGLVAISLPAALLIQIAALIPLALGIVSVCRSINYFNEASKYKHGLEGEELLKSELKDILKGNYTAIYNLPLTACDLDCIVIGPNCIIAFEIKHHKGLINAEGGNWSQHKWRRDGTTYPGESFINPIKQLGKSIYQIRSRLKDYGLNCWVSGYVVFTNPEMTLNVSDMENRKIKAVQIADLNVIFNEKTVRLNPSAQSKLVEAIRKIGQDALNG